MKIHFEGTFEEFARLFPGLSRRRAVARPDQDMGEGKARPSWPQAAARKLPFLSVVPGEGEIEEPELPAPESTQRGSIEVELPAIKDKDRVAAWQKFREVVVEWTRGFEQEGVEQPDRLAMLTELGSGRWPVPVLVMAYERKSLQRLVEQALLEHNPAAPAGFNTPDEWLDFVGRVAGNMVQVSHMAFPDLAGTYDHSTKWRNQ